MLSELAPAPPDYDEPTRAYQAQSIAAIEAMDRPMAMRLSLMAAFALTRQEALCFDPARADYGDFIALEDERGKFLRLVQVRAASLRALLNRAREVLAVEANALPDEYPAQYRKLNGMAKRQGLDWTRFLAKIQDA